jgi:hypothetical protein
MKELGYDPIFFHGKQQEEKIVGNEHGLFFEDICRASACVRYNRE